jgi:hypothetical protein
LCLFATNPLLNLVLEHFMKFNSARNWQRKPDKKLKWLKTVAI